MLFLPGSHDNDIPAAGPLWPGCLLTGIFYLYYISACGAYDRSGSAPAPAGFFARYLTVAQHNRSVSLAR